MSSVQKLQRILELWVYPGIMGVEVECGYLRLRTLRDQAPPAYVYSKEIA